MAAHDEKISQNRRRLFKALSTAPVVATLSPGSALATQSAFQCLSSEVVAQNFHETGTMCSVGDPDCFVYETKVHWRGGEATVNPSVPGNTALWPTGIADLNQPGIVIVESETAPGSFFVRVDDTTSVPLVAPLLDVNVSLDSSSGTSLLVNFTDPNTTITTTYLEFPNRDGVALTLFERVGSPPTAVNRVGVLPDQHPGGNIQGLAATCLTSVDPGNASSFTLAKG
ncbi:MAG: hypothetical protein QNJ91_04985 [Gammaproteobacteria bacterium]|nr:hypothetical protein [Gammaproteobacteria bacterium]